MESIRIPFREPATSPTGVNDTAAPPLAIVVRGLSRVHGFQAEVGVAFLNGDVLVGDGHQIRSTADQHRLPFHASYCL